MNELVKLSIDSRLNAIYNAYEITQDDIKNKLENLFKRIEEFGTSCTDNMDFEIKFISSPLNQEYIELFTNIATSCPLKNIENNENSDVKSDVEYIKDEVLSDIKYVADDLTQPMRHEAYQKTYDEARDVPILGDAMNVKQHLDFLSKFRKNKDE